MFANNINVFMPDIVSYFGDARRMVERKKVLNANHQHELKKETGYFCTSNYLTFSLNLNQ